MVLAHLAALSAFSTGELWTCSLKSLDRQVLVEHLSSLWFPLFYKSSVVMIHKQCAGRIIQIMERYWCKPSIGCANGKSFQLIIVYSVPCTINLLYNYMQTKKAYRST